LKTVKELERSAIKGADKGTLWYICGMPEDVQQTREFLLESGVHADSILLEEFWGY